MPLLHNKVYVVVAAVKAGLPLCWRRTMEQQRALKNVNNFNTNNNSYLETSGGQVLIYNEM
jgi:hypothetical protein